MIAFLSALFLVGVVAASPLNANPHDQVLDLAVGRRAATTTIGSCPGHSTVYKALLSYTSAAQFCSTFLPINAVTATVSTTSTTTLTSTISVTTGTAVSTVSPSGTTITSTTTSTVTITSTSAGIASSTYTKTSIVTVTTATSGLAACAASATVAKHKRAAATTTTSSTATIPSQLTKFAPSNLSAGCSCLSLTTATVTSTTVASAVVTTTKTVDVIKSTTTTAPLSNKTTATTVIATVTHVVTGSTTAVVTSVITSTSTVAGAQSTAASFYLKSSNNHYVSIANVAGGDLYLELNTTAGADIFTINSKNQLVVATQGSQYQNFTAVGNPANSNEYDDWYPIKVHNGTDAPRPTLCCGVTPAGLLSCAYGEIFGYCYDGELYEGSQAATKYDYYYSALDCTSVSLSVVAV